MAWAFNLAAGRGVSEGDQMKGGVPGGLGWPGQASSFPVAILGLAVSTAGRAGGGWRRSLGCSGCGWRWLALVQLGQPVQRTRFGKARAVGRAGGHALQAAARLLARLASPLRFPGMLASIMHELAPTSNASTGSARARGPLLSAPAPVSRPARQWQQGSTGLRADGAAAGPRLHRRVPHHTTADLAGSTAHAAAKLAGLPPGFFFLPGWLTSRRAGLRGCHFFCLG